MNEHEAEEIQQDFAQVALSVGNEILRRLSTAEPERFSTWLTDAKFNHAPKYALSFEASLKTAAEMKTNRILGAEFIAEAEE